MDVNVTVSGLPFMEGGIFKLQEKHYRWLLILIIEMYCVCYETNSNRHSVLKRLSAMICRSMLGGRFVKCGQVYRVVILRTNFHNLVSWNVVCVRAAYFTPQNYSLGSVSFWIVYFLECEPHEVHYNILIFPVFLSISSCKTPKPVNC